MAKVRLIIDLGDFEFDKQNYSKVYDEQGNQFTLTDAEKENLTEKQMLEYEQRFLDHGVYGPEEYFSEEDKARLELIGEEANG